MPNTSLQQPGRHVCVCLSHNLQNQKAIEAAADAARSSGGSLEALYVEEPNYPMLSSRVKKQLREDVQYAQFMGATFRTILSNETHGTITEYCRIHEIDLLVIGDPGPIRSARPWFSSLTRKLLENNMDVELLIVPSEELKAHSSRSQWGRLKTKTLPSDLLKTFLIVLLSTVLCVLFDQAGLDNTAIIPILFLGVLMTSLSTGNWLCSILSTISCSLLYNFLFAEPKFTFNDLSASFSMTFLVLFVVSLITSLLASKLQIQSKQSSSMSYRAQILFETNRMLQQVQDPDELVSKLCSQIVLLTSRNVVYYPFKDGKPQERILYETAYQALPSAEGLDKEMNAVMWAAEHRAAAGAGTLHYPEARTVYMPCATSSTIYGVVGIHVDEDTIDSIEIGILRTSISEGSFLLENALQTKEIIEARQNQAIEVLRNGMLRNIGHDIRSPLTVIVGDTDQLLAHNLDPRTQQDLTVDIQKNAQELMLLIENLLAASKLESGTMAIHANPEMLSELVESALDTSGIEEKGHTIEVEHEDDLLMVKADASQIVRAMINLLTNCDQYTPKGSAIKVRTSRQNGMALVEILDQGSGIPESKRKNLFSAFNVSDDESDSSRNAGMGLFLCKKIIDAHHGTIGVKPNEPKGSNFFFTLPIVEYDSEQYQEM